MFWWIVLFFAIVGYVRHPNWWGALSGAMAGATAGLVVFGILMWKRRHVSRLNMHNAASMGNVKRIRELLKVDPRVVNAKDKDGRTPLHCAIGYFELGVVEELLAHNADANAKDNNGLTPLHVVAAGVPSNPPPPPKSVEVMAAGLEGIHLKIAELLLSHGADLYARTEWGWTPLETAEQSHTGYMVELLRRHPPRQN